VTIGAFLLARIIAIGAGGSALADAPALHEQFARLLAELPSDISSSGGGYVQEIAPQALHAPFVKASWKQPSFSRARASYEQVLQRYPALRTDCTWLDAREREGGGD
jgi:hypothetical protein